MICEMDGILVPFFVEDFRYKTDTVVLVKLEDVNSEEDARMFVGKEVILSFGRRGRGGSRRGI